MLKHILTTCRHDEDGAGIAAGMWWARCSTTRACQRLRCRIAFHLLRLPTAAVAEARVCDAAIATHHGFWSMSRAVEWTAVIAQSTAPHERALLRLGPSQTAAAAGVASRLPL
eukprot:365708-Chlamydomonas_euryale.AAC.12